MKLKRGFLLVILTIFLEFLAFPPINFSYIAFIALVPMYYFLYREKRIWTRFLGIFLYRFILAIVTVYFIFEPLLFIQTSIILALIVFPLAFIERKFSPKFVLLSIPILWAIFEHIEARYTLIGFYAMTLGNLFGNSQFLGLAKIGGLFPMTLYVSIINGIFLIFTINIAKKTKKRKKQKQHIILIVLLILITLALGFLLSKIFIKQNENVYENLNNKLDIAIVSANKNYTSILQRFGDKELSLELEKEAKEEIKKLFEPIEREIAKKKVDIIFLPDEFIERDFFYFTKDIANERYGIENGGITIRNYQELAQHHKTYVLANMITYRNNTNYNSMLLFNSSGDLIDIYDKVHLTFGSEYWPFNFSIFYYYDTFAGNSYFKYMLQSLLPDINDGSMFFRLKYTAGKPKAININNLSILTPICNEAHYISEVSDYTKKFDSKIIFATSGNRWIKKGLNNYLTLFLNLRKIESVYLQKPIVINGRPESAGVIMPNGKFEGIVYEAQPIIVYITNVKY